MEKNDKKTTRQKKRGSRASVHVGGDVEPNTGADHRRSQTPVNDGAAQTLTGSPTYNQLVDWSATGRNIDSSKYSGGSVEHNDLQRAKDISLRIENIFAQKVVGQDRMRVALLSTLIAGGHILIESVPGLAKTTAASAICGAISGTFSRIQCTPDLMPNDIVGTQIYNYSTGEFKTQLGPVHANLVLLDEINRSSAKTQSAMLEAMQEKQTTIGSKTFPLPDPFLVIATQNPIEEEGTYVLPEAQMDRFLLKEVITYPTPDQEVQVLEGLLKGKFNSTSDLENSHTSASISDSVLPATLDDLRYLQEVSKRVYLSPAVLHYIISIINTTRGGGPNPIVGLDKLVRVGASPRGSIAFVRVCQAFALLNGRAYVIPEDVIDMRYPVLRHRIVRTFDALADNLPVESIIDQVFQVVPVP
jgi:MoxR-like ATPase